MRRKAEMGGGAVLSEQLAKLERRFRTERRRDYLVRCDFLGAPSARSSQNTAPYRSYRAAPVVTGENGAAAGIVPEVPSAPAPWNGL